MFYQTKSLIPKSDYNIKYRLWITCSGQENDGNDHQWKKLSIRKQILLVSTLGNVETAVWNEYEIMKWICILKINAELKSYYC